MTPTTTIQSEISGRILSEQLAENNVDSLFEPLLTAPAAAALLSVRTSWIYDAVRAGKLPCVRVGKHLRFLRSDLARWVGEHPV